MGKKAASPVGASGPGKRGGLGLSPSILTAVIVALSVAAATAATYLAVRSVGEPAASDRALATLSGSQGVQSALQQQRFLRLNLISRVFASDQVLSVYLAEAAQTRAETDLALALKAYQDLLVFDLAVIVDRNGVVLTATDGKGRNENLAAIPLVSVALAEKKASGVWARGDQILHAVAVPLARNYELVGYIIIGYSINNTFATQVQRTGGAHTVFLTSGSAGPTVAATTLDKTQSQQVIASLRKSGGVLDDVMRRGETVERVAVDLDGADWVASLVPLRDASGGAVGAALALTSVDEGRLPFAKIRDRALFAGLTALVLGTLAALLLGGSRDRPLSAVAAAAEQAAQGHYELTMPPAKGELGRISESFTRLLGQMREQQAMQFVMARLSRLLPEPAKSPARLKPQTQKGALVVVEMRRLANPKLGYDPEESLARLGRDLQRINTSTVTQKGTVVAVSGHRAVAAFEGENSAYRALSMATEVLLTLSERENVFDEPDPPVIAITFGSLILGTVAWGESSGTAAIGLPVQQLESLLREATPGELYFTRPVYDELAAHLQRAQIEVKAQRGILSPQPLLLIHKDAAARATGSRALSETRANFPGEGRSLSEVRPGLVLGNRFEIQAELGAGRAGIVFKARDRELNDFVTLKLLRPEVVQDVAQFERLKRAVARARNIRHPNVLSVLDFGEAEKIPYIQMEFARGLTLAFVLEQAKALPMVAAVRLARQMAWGLAAAHGQQLMHGGLKPENVLIEGDGTVRLMDFGVGTPPRPGMVAGNPLFLAPEQLEGREPDSRADFYAWGAVVYAAATGRAPYPGSNADEIRQRMAAGELESPSGLAGEMPRKLDEILVRALGRTPEQRYQTVAELVADLEQVAV